MPEGYKNGKPDVPYWIEQIKFGLEWRKMMAFEERWDAWRKYYRGEWKPEILANNVFFRMIRSTVPRIYFRNPSISILDRRGGFENMVLAQILQRVDNILVRRMNMKNEMKNQVQRAWMFGTGVGKLGFGAQFAVKPDEPGSTAPPLVGRGRNRQQVEYDNLVFPNMPWYRAVQTESLILPWGCTNISDARWNAFMFKRPLEDVKDDPRFKNTKDLGVSMDGQKFDIDFLHKYALENRLNEVDLIEVRDTKTGKVFVISPTVEESLVFEDDFFSQLGITPLKSLVFNWDDRTCWGVPDSQILEPLQKEINENMTYAMWHRRLSLLRVIAQRGMVEEDEIDKFLSGDPHMTVWVNGDVREALGLQQASFIPPDIWQYGSQMETTVRDSMGFSRNQAGEFKQGSRSPTATEVQAVREASEIRVDERRDMVADLLVDVFNDVHPLIFNQWNQEQVVDIVGPGGIPIWVAFRPSMLKRGQFEIEVDPDSSVPETKELREQKAMLVYERLKTNPLIDPLDLTRYLLHEMHGVAFDHMMRGLPENAGMGPENPLSVGQAGQLFQNVSGQLSGGTGEGGV